MHSTVKLALDWQQTGLFAEFWESAGGEENRLYELAGCRVAIGEQIGLACTAERDFLGWERLTFQTPEEAVAEF